MPDTFNRYNLAEIRAYVLRNLSSLQAAAVDPTTGQESGTPLLGLNTQFSVQNLNIRINSALTKTSLLINAENDTIYRAEVFYDAVPTVLQYALPPDLLQISGLWWKPQNISAPASPKNYFLMSMQDTLDGPSGFRGQLFRPTWRRVGQYIQLNQDPGDFAPGINQQGIWFKYLRWNTFLVNDTDYIDLPYAQVVQEIVAYDATLECVRTQDEMVDVSGIEKSLAYWNQQLEILIRNAYRPTEIRMIGPTYVKNTFSGRE